MKSCSTLLLLLISILSIYTADAQTVTLGTSEMTLDSMEIDAAHLIAYGEEDDIIDAFDKWLKKNYDINIDRKKLLFIDRKLITTEDVSIPVLSDKKINLYVRSTQHSSDQAELKIGARNFINGNPVESTQALQEMQMLLLNFASEYLVEHHRDILSDSQDHYDDLNKDIRKAEDKISNNHKKIDKLQREIEDLAKEISDLESAKEDATRQVQTHQARLDELESDLKHLHKKAKS